MTNQEHWQKVKEQAIRDVTKFKDFDTFVLGSPPMTVITMMYNQAAELMAQSIREEYESLLLSQQFSSSAASNEIQRITNLYGLEKLRADTATTHWEKCVDEIAEKDKEIERLKGILRNFTRDF